MEKMRQLYKIIFLLYDINVLHYIGVIIHASLVYGHFGKIKKNNNKE